MRVLPFSLLLIVCAITFADDPVTEPRSSSPEQRLVFAKAAAESYQFRVGNSRGAEAKLVASPLLRWNNKVVREDDGFLFLWTEEDKGRPLAGAQFFVVDKVWHHEFQSLSTKRFDARSNNDRDWTWQPKTAGLDFVEASDIDLPADSPALRLRQMKALAERFTAAVDMNEDFSTPEQLRLLTTPVYRYSSQDHLIVDGAIVAFVQGTNPEILLIVEAVAKDGAIQWQYGFARMSSYNLRVYQDARIVWKNVRVAVPTNDPASPFQFRLAAQVDLSADVKIPAMVKDAK